MSDINGFAPAPGTSLYYELTGAGEPVVLLHGFSLDRRMWDDQVPALARRYLVVRYDLRGFGRSEAGDLPYSHADDLAALLDHLALRRVSLIGLSLGGGAAINFAVTRPDQVRTLIVVDPSLGGYAWSPEYTDAQREIRATATTKGLNAARAQWLSLPLFAHALKKPDVARRLHEMVRDYPGSHWNAPDRGRPLKPPAAERLADIRARTLVIVGEHDAADFHGIAKVLTEGIAGVRGAVIPGVGHMANMENPTAFNALAVEFLRGKDATGDVT